MSNANLVPVAGTSVHTIYHLSENERVDTRIGIHLVGESDIIVYWNGDEDACSHLWDRIQTHSERWKARGKIVKPTSRGRLAYKAKESNLLIPVDKTSYHLTFSSSTELLEIANGLPLALFNCRDKYCDEFTSAEMRYGYFCVRRPTSNKWFQCLGKDEFREIQSVASTQSGNQHRLGDYTIREGVSTFTPKLRQPGRQPETAAPTASFHTPGCTLATAIVISDDEPLNVTTRELGHQIPVEGNGGQNRDPTLVTQRAPSHHSPPLKTRDKIASNQESAPDLTLTRFPNVQVSQPSLVALASVQKTPAVPATTSREQSPRTTATTPIVTASRSTFTIRGSGKVGLGRECPPVSAWDPKINTPKLGNKRFPYKATKNGNSTKKRAKRGDGIPRRFPRITATFLSSTILNRDRPPRVKAAEDSTYLRNYIYKSDRGCYDTPGGSLIPVKKAHFLEAAKKKGKTELEVLLAMTGYENKGYERFTQDLGEQIVNLL